jgi:hypothetical protein
MAATLHEFSAKSAGNKEYVLRNLDLSTQNKDTAIHHNTIVL